MHEQSAKNSLLKEFEAMQAVPNKPWFIEQTIVAQLKVSFRTSLIAGRWVSSLPG